METTIKELCDRLCNKCTDRPALLNFVLSYGDEKHVATALKISDQTLQSKDGYLINEQAEIAMIIAEHGLFPDQEKIEREPKTDEPSESKKEETEVKKIKKSQRKKKKG